jgi:hypothetical protein
MKSIIIMALFLCACGFEQSATVLSNDGSTKVGYCYGSRWIICASTLCPNGYTVVERPSCDGCNGIIKCK